jgi:hypothetical protein
MDLARSDAALSQNKRGDFTRRRMSYSYSIPTILVASLSQTGEGVTVMPEFYGPSLIDMANGGPITLDTLRRAKELLMQNPVEFTYYDEGPPTQVFESTNQLSGFTWMWSGDRDYIQPSRPKPAMTIKEHNDEREFWETMLLNQFITWKECLKGMRACRKREKM